MSNARDKANIPALNFSSTGIDDNATSTAITINSSEQVGIAYSGTLNGRLNVNGNVGLGNFISASNPTGGTYNLTDPNGKTINKIVRIGEDDDGTINTIADLQLVSYGQAANGGGGNLRFVNSRYSNDVALIKGSREGTDTGYLAFYTENSGLKERMHIHDNGDISFYEDTGTTPKFFWDASAETLSIGSSTTSNILRLDNSTPTVFDLSATNTGQDALFIRSSSETSAVNAKGNSIGFGAPDGHSNRHASISAVQTSSDRDFVGLAFHTHNSGSQSDPMIETMRLTSDGKLGIGITSPTQKLDVNGTVKATAFQGDGSALTNLPGGGKVLQVVSTEKSDTFSSSGTSFQDITGLTATITPSSTSSKILVLVNISSGADNGYKYGFRLLRSGTVINEGDSAGSRKLVSIGLHSNSSLSFESSSIVYLDSPNTTSSRQYDIQGSTEGSNFYVNRTYTDTDAASHMRATSNITLIEIGA